MSGGDSEAERLVLVTGVTAGKDISELLVCNGVFGINDPISEIVAWAEKHNLCKLSITLPEELEEMLRRTV